MISRLLRTCPHSSSVPAPVGEGPYTQSSVVVVEFNNHEMLAKIGLPRAESCFSAKETKLHRLLFRSGARVSTQRRSVVILLHWLHMSLMKPRQNVTIGAEHCRAGHVQA